MEDELFLTVNGQAISGWTHIRVSRGIERCPSDFDIGFTEQFPGEAAAVIAKPGDPCVVKLAGDVVLTGYVDRLNINMDNGAHTLAMVGRSKCADVVDCSAEWPGFQIVNCNALAIATKLAGRYGIKVTATGQKGPVLDQFNLLHGERVWDVIERACRWSALLVYDQPDGNLLLTNAGTVRAASGVRQGDNVQSSAVTFGQDQRFSNYRCFQQSVEVMNDVGNGGNLVGVAEDPEIERYRLLEFVTEAPHLGRDFNQRRATWEMNRRMARSTVLQVTVDSWRDSDGRLWEPNTLVPVEMPGSKLGDIGAPVEMIVAAVSYQRDPTAGTTAHLTLMPPKAFDPMPVLQFNKFGDVAPKPGSPAILWGIESQR